MKKRLLSLLLCLCICIGFLPTSGFAALAKPEGIMITYGDSVPVDYCGTVLELKQEADGFYSIRVGLINVPESNTYVINFQYDKTKVEYCDSSGESYESTAGPSDSLTPENCQASMFKASASEGNKTEHLAKKVTETVIEAATITTGGTGMSDNQVSIMLSTPATAYSAKLKATFEGLSATSPNTYVMPIGSVIYAYKLYFKSIGGATIDHNTFTFYSNDETDYAGAATYNGGTNPTSYGAYFVNFPATETPAPSTYPVKVIVGPTAAEQSAALDGSNSNWLASPTVTIQSAAGDGGAPTDTYPETTFTGGATGLLTQGGTAVGGDGILDLEVGWYKYKVTPALAETSYAEHSGYFQVATAGDSEVKMVYIHAQAAGAAQPQDYTLTLLDNESANGKSAFSSGNVKVTLGGTPQTYTMQDGKITLSATPNVAAVNMIVEMDKYIVRSFLTTASNGVVFNADGTMTNTAIASNELLLTQKRSDITLTAPTSPAYFTISARTGGMVTDNMAANELPMTVAAAGAGNTATVSLPDGDYVYTMVTPGNQDMDKELAVKSNESPSKITISDAGGGNPTVQTPTLKGDGTGYETTADATATGTPNVITDPMYQVVGEWAKTGETVTGMTVKVYLKNIKATQGTFGLRYDPAVFTLDTASNGFAADSKIVVPAVEKITVGSHEGSTPNPTAESGYHAFRWNAAHSGDTVAAVDGTAGAALIATYNLDLTAAALNDGYRTMMHDKSLYVQPYAKTVGATVLKAVYNAAGALDSYPLFIADLWRPTDGANTVPGAGSGRLTTDKAMMGGFHQVTNATVEGDTWDVLSQLVFENTTGRTAIYFSVAEKDTNLAVKDATVSVQQGVDEVGTGKTDAFGDTIIPVPVEGDYGYGVSAEGYQSVTGSVAAADIGKTVSVVLDLSDMHKVRIHDDQTGSTALIGNGAQNGVDYYFMLAPQPGYAWPNGLPAATDLEIKLIPKNGANNNASPIPAEKLTWDAPKNQYKLVGDAIAGVSTDDLVIKIKATSNEPIPTPADNNHTVTVTAGTGGSFDYADVTPASTFADAGGGAAATTGAKVAYIKEKMGVGEGTSAKYTIKGNGPVDTTAVPDPVQATAKYRAQVINKFLVNGTAMDLTDYERIYGVADYQLFAITSDQTITVTFCEVTVDPGTPGDDGDDVIDPDGPVTYPEESVVTFIISDHGSAVVNGTNPTVTDDSVTGPASRSYTLTATTGTLTAAFTGASGVTPPGGGTAVSYELDTVLIDGVAATSGQLTGNTLTLGGLEKGTTHQVVATFKPVGGTTIYASLELVHYAGDGTATPIGNSIWPVGLPAAIQLDPASGWQLGAVDLTKPGDSGVTDVTKNAVAGSGTSYTYTTPSLTAGITKVGFQFKEHTYKVEVLMNYAMRGSANVVPYTPATFTFTRTSGIPLTITYGPSETGEYKLAKPTQKEAGLRFDLPLGTWSLTVSKHGYLNYVVTDFVIAMDSGTLKAGSAGDLTAVIGTAGSEQLIYFGRTGSESKSRSVAPIIGDATWDGKLIAANDIGQVANGMVSGATPAQKTRADIDESILTSGAGTVNAADMSYVVENYGAVRTNLTYSDFMNLSISGS